MTTLDVRMWQSLYGGIQDSSFLDQTFTAWRALGNPYLMGIFLALSMSAILFGLIAAAYRPRIPRGAFWAPAFGLFGASPKLYYHTRPPSLFGLFHTNRRLVRSAHKKHHKHAAS